LPRIARERGLGLRQGCCSSTKQESGQQEIAAAFVTESQGFPLLFRTLKTFLSSDEAAALAVPDA
jgi:hypothetical protein